ncbi:MAG: type II secretion system protein [Candidatus Eremiobacterota bacterium]
MLKRIRGFTLAETLVSLAIIGLFMLVAVGGVTMALRSWGAMADRINAVQNASFATRIISTELRQAIAGVSAPAVSLPNPAVLESEELRFTEPDPAAYRPEQAGWDSANPDNYRDVTYRIENRSLVRISRPPAGPERKEIVCSPSRDGNLQVLFRYQGTRLIDVTVTATEGDARPVTYTTRCYVVGR